MNIRKIRLGACLLLLALNLTGCQGNEMPLVIETETGSTQGTETGIPDSGIHQSDKQQTDELVKTEIFIDVSGAVVNPGVYELPADARIYEAIQRAGGLLPDADKDSLNQAEKLSDGQKIRVYTSAEAETMAIAKVAADPEAQRDSNIVNLNTADEAGLMTLPGIGEAKAKDIIAYRTEQGGFKSIEEIKNISGIKDAVFNKIKDKIVV
ncbi:MAG: ComEA family DNA-binding protein [Clostridiales bacterium]|uniref:helix-hairpin-helix domain-containing protein n=1 Tax=Robinsoniella sp. TaxID=2496533 RepID=UPI002909AC28|nr:ComEA family DNA-binding protein [Clostridiales bacterium]MDU3243179.1 ComEA family DNA-binding protein [Clostridiales bacterium]